MDAYVGVTNAASVAVKSILQIKKAFRTQMKCIEDLSHKDESSQQTIRQLEKEKKELLALVGVFMQEEDLNDISKNASQECLSPSRSNKKSKDGIPTANTNSKCNDPDSCPASPKTLNDQGGKRKCTPAKIVRKSRRISTRK